MSTVIKRSGASEPLDIAKIHRVIEWACEGIQGVSVSEVAIKSRLQLFDGISTEQIHATLVKSAADLITENSPNYQYVAGRLLNYSLRKRVWGGPTPPSLQSHITKVTELGYYDPDIVVDYSEEEIEFLSNKIDHDRDLALTYAGIAQFEAKYLVRNRATRQFFETPQFAYMLMAMTAFSKSYQGKRRLQLVTDYYDAISKHVISLPTPIMAGLRTPDRQFSSCVLIDTDDSIESINATTSATVTYVSQKAGIGINGGRIRAINSPIRGGKAVHTGATNFYRLFMWAINSVNQGNVRKGSGNITYPLWHREFPNFIHLKNSKGTEFNSARHVDYTVQLNRLMYERLLTGGNITLFCPNDVPDLYDAFFSDQELFNKLYVQYEKTIPEGQKKTVKAIDLFTDLLNQRKETSRIYIQNIDHCNTHGSFDEKKAPIKMTNLCVEITLPTKPLNNILDEDGRIALCTLSGINMGAIKSPDDFEKPCELAIRALDAILSYQSYPIKAAELHTKEYRPLGVGITNFAFWMAKNGMTYSQPDLQLLHQYFEAYMFYLLKASVQLAKEFGPCDKYTDTKYSQGILPIDTYKKDVDQLAAPVYLCDWNQLSQDMIKYGIRNSTVAAQMPFETSSATSNSINGIEPPRASVTKKQSEDGVISQVIPQIQKYRKSYEYFWDIPNPRGYLSICAVLQKFMDQAISVNTTYNPRHYPDQQISMTDLIQDLAFFYKMGGKNLYYSNTYDQQGDQLEADETELEEVTEETCEGCAI